VTCQEKSFPEHSNVYVCSVAQQPLCPKKISAVKKGEAKKVQVAERLKDVISL